MRIGIDFTAAVQQHAGIGRYTRELIRAIAQRDRRNTYVLFQAVRGATQPAGTWPANFKIRTVPLSDHWLTVLWHKLKLPIPVEACIGAVDVFHSPDFLLPPVRHAKTVLTIHDLSFFTTPETAHPGLRDFLAQAVPRAVARADHLLADSQSTKNDLVEYLQVPAQRITVVYPGVDPRFRPLDQATVAGLRARYHLDQPFILAVGTLQPRKNYVRLIQAYAHLRDLDEELRDVKLVIAGSEGWLFEEIYATVQHLGLEKQVRFMAYFPDADLPALYNAAAVLAMPSLYEGFGFPVLEALACGTPVVTSDVSSLPEVAGDAALLVPPLDVEALSTALHRLLTDTALRARLRERGLIQAQRFRWQQAAQTTLAVYQHLVSA